MTNIAVRVENVSKSYTIAHEGKRYRTLREDLIALIPGRGSPRTTRETFWALRDVSFEVPRGEVMGIIGRNGAGKSTLLKILARITKPTTGSIDLYGRVGSLLEVGTGFHPELTGHENIYLSGTILGMRRAEIARQFDAIVDFAEVEQFLDTPVKRYSSGMYMRLAFAVAAHLEPEILIVDEVLAVGDAAFQKKSLGKMGDVAKSGRTVLFVSHNMAAVEALCSRALLLERGRTAFLGAASEAIGRYLTHNAAMMVSLEQRLDRVGTGEVRVIGIQLCDVAGNRIEAATSGQDIEVHFLYEAQPDFFRRNLRFSLLLKTASDMPVFLHHNRLTREPFDHLPPKGAFVCRIHNLPLSANVFKITYSLMIGEESYIDYLEHAADLTVIAGDFFGSGEIPPPAFGPLLVAANWSLVAEDVYARP